MFVKNLAANRSATVRSWVALAFFIAAYFGFAPLEAALHRPLARLLGLHMLQDGLLAPVPYAVLMVVRLGLDLLVVAGLLAIQQRRVRAFPLAGPARGRLTLAGLLTGLVVMTAAISGILLTGGATAHLAQQSLAAGLLNGTSWLAFDYLGALGEELAGRVAVLLVMQPLVGRRGALLASGLLFVWIHLDNPGVSWLWLLRLFLQGVLLAYAVYRTGSFWWSVGYHTGWNWASAPLFGAAGSGYLDRGHLFDFLPTGPAWLTGGEVGPEGSLFAFLAVAAAAGLLAATTPQGFRTAGKVLA